MAARKARRRYLKPSTLVILIIACAGFAWRTDTLFVLRAVMDFSRRPPAKHHDSSHHSSAALADLQNLQKLAGSPRWPLSIIMCNAALLIVSLTYLFYLTRKLVRFLKQTAQPACPAFKADEVVDIKLDEFRGRKSFGHGLWQGTFRSIEADDEEDFWQRPG